jgi:hypothetical protein
MYTLLKNMGEARYVMVGVDERVLVALPGSGQSPSLDTVANAISGDRVFKMNLLAYL